jgi:hypothetical protein
MMRLLAEQRRFSSVMNSYAICAKVSSLCSFGRRDFANGKSYQGANSVAFCEDLQGSWNTNTPHRTNWPALVVQIACPGWSTTGDVDESRDHAQQDSHTVFVIVMIA